MFNKLILGFIGMSAGGIIAGGVFAFLAMIGIFPRLIGKTGTTSRVLLYETMIILGGLAGNALYLYPVIIGIGGLPVMGIFGFSVGVFVGVLVMSLAETLKAIPVMNRRIHLAVGFQYVIFIYAIGKMLGSLVYFARDMGV